MPVEQKEGQDESQIKAELEATLDVSIPPEVDVEKIQLVLKYTKNPALVRTIFSEESTTEEKNAAALRIADIFDTLFINFQIELDDAELASTMSGRYGSSPEYGQLYYSHNNNMKI